MLSLPKRCVPEGWSIPSDACQAGQYLSWLADGQDTHGWYAGPSFLGPRYGWDDAPVCSPHVPSPDDTAPLQHKRWAVVQHHSTRKSLAFKDGSRLLIARHHGQRFFLPWPVQGEGGDVTELHARAGWTAYTQSYAAFSWRQIKATLDEEERTRIKATLRTIARACADLLMGTGITKVTLQWSLSPSFVDPQSTLFAPWADITAEADDLDDAQDEHLRHALQQGNDAAQVALMGILNTHASWMRCLQQGEVCFKGKDTNAVDIVPRRFHPLTSGFAYDHTVGSAHRALRGRAILAPYLSPTTAPI